MTKPMKIVAILTAKPDKAEALHSLLASMIAPSRAEPGNLSYDLWRDQTDPARFVLDELYANQAAIDKHRAAEHFRAYLASITDLADRTSLVLEAVDTH